MYLNHVQQIGNFSTHTRLILSGKESGYKESVYNILAKGGTGYKLMHLLENMNNGKLDHIEILQMSDQIMTMKLLIDAMIYEIVRTNIHDSDVIREITNLKRMIGSVLYNLGMSQLIISERLPPGKQRILLQIAGRVNTTKSYS